MRRRYVPHADESSDCICFCWRYLVKIYDSPRCVLSTFLRCCCMCSYFYCWYFLLLQFSFYCDICKQYKYVCLLLCNCCNVYIIIKFFCFLLFFNLCYSGCKIYIGFELYFPIYCNYLLMWQYVAEVKKVEELELMHN